MKRSKADIYRDLTWADVQAWAGASVTSRGRSYQRSHRVKDLALAPAGGLVAWVYGTQRYATLVDAEDGRLTSACTCPYDGTCKHAVAMVLEYLEQLKRDSAVPTASGDDPRLALLASAREGTEEGEDADLLEAPAGRAAASPGGKKSADDLHSYLEKQTKGQLVSLLEELSGRYPAVRKALRDRCHLSAGEVRKLVNAVAREIGKLSAEPGWRNSWSGEGNIPDYSDVRDRLQVLLDGGHADEVVDLGKILLEAGTRQVEMSDDEGETGIEIAACLKVVFEALPRSSLSPSDQMLWAVEAMLADEYELCGGAGEFLDRKHLASDWNILADKLLERLRGFRARKGEERDSSRYDRDRLSDWAILALEGAGRQPEVIPLCQQEAPKTGSYVRLVECLLEADRREEAGQWIRTGIRATQKELPGIASELKDIRRKMLEQEEDWPGAAALRADEFFAHPALRSFGELRQAAERAGVWPAVRAAAMRYLETGRLPESTGEDVGDGTVSPWPLPETGVREPIDIRQGYFPLTGTLIDIAIADKQPDEVLRWYDHAGAKSPFSRWTWFQDDKIADAIAGKYPDRAIAIWKRLAESDIARTKPKAYDQAATYLVKMRRVLLRTGKEEEWRSYLAGLLFANARKKRLLEVLKAVDGRRIIESEPAPQGERRGTGPGGMTAANEGVQP